LGGRSETSFHYLIFGNAAAGPRCGGLLRAVCDNAVADLRIGRRFALTHTGRGDEVRDARVGCQWGGVCVLQAATLTYAKWPGAWIYVTRQLTKTSPIAADRAKSRRVSGSGGDSQWPVVTVLTAAE
jgi:hypothetical protein